MNEITNIKIMPNNKNPSFDILKIANKKGYFEVKKNRWNDSLKEKCDFLVRQGYLWRGKDTKKMYVYFSDKKETS